MSNTFLHGGRKNFKGDSPVRVMSLGQSRDREAPDTLSASDQFTPLPAEAEIF